VAEERVPFQITESASLYKSIEQLPVTVLLDNFRSLYNVGSFFRTADACAAQALLLCGITGKPPQRGISKTALGAEETVRWEHSEDSLGPARTFRERGYDIAVVETSVRAVDVYDWVPQFPVCLVFGNELEGVRPELIEMADVHVRIPMLGLKHSLNVATAGGIVLFELLRKYRGMLERARMIR
jgi:tRNA G18 (ribose-2'-O)-methylase SpoU